MKRLVVLLAILGAALSVGGAVRAQAPLFHSETRRVVVYATVKNSRGDLVTNLDQNAFTVYENGKPQPIVLFRNDDVPISLGIVIDNSGSMKSKRAKVEAAALALVRASNSQDEVFVLNFADKAQLDVPFTSDLKTLESGISRVDAIGGTAMRDAVDVAEEYFEQHATRDRKVLLIITDGNDNASVAEEKRIRARAERGQIVIHAIGLLNDDDSSEAKRARNALDDLAEVTGGVTFYPENLDDVHTVALDLARQMRSQYMIAYRPLNEALDGGYRTIRVTAKGDGKLTVHTRPGYRASKSPSAP
jgi:Ca-activated chloride channel family protein